jgi:peptide chain release factor 1
MDVSKYLNEFESVEKQLSDPNVHTDQLKSKRLSRRYNELKQIKSVYTQLLSAQNDLKVAREFEKTDKSFIQEIDPLTEKIDIYNAKLEELLIPKDSDNGRDIIAQIKAGAGGEESALFAGDLFNMYERFSQKQNWKFSLIDITRTELGGIKDASISIKSRDENNGVWAKMKFEGGVHRVQRIPTTESQGRIHTSAVGVLVLPELDDDKEIEIKDSDIKVDVFRSSGPGGQSVNTTDSAVRITHLKTGIVVTCQNQKSQLQNKEQAMRVLKARLLEIKKNEQDIKDSNQRKAQVRTVDRSMRIRTYNFPENRVSDHRTGFKSYNLDKILEGELDALIESCINKEKENYLKNND